MMIREILLTTADKTGTVHLAPMGLQQEGELYLIQPFRPSKTLDNCLATRTAVVNYCEDVRLFAGCLTGHRDWPTLPSQVVATPRLQQSLSHTELQLEKIGEADSDRPRLYFRAVHQAMHAPFQGYNRAQFAVIEAAILISRLHMLPREKVERELEYLQIAIDKTAGADEQQAWGWLMERCNRYYHQADIRVMKT